MIRRWARGLGFAAAGCICLLAGGLTALLAGGLPVRGIDVAPTVLAMLALPQPAGFQGLDLTPLAQGFREPARLAAAPNRSGPHAAPGAESMAALAALGYLIAKDPLTLPVPPPAKGGRRAAPPHTGH